MGACVCSGANNRGGEGATVYICVCACVLGEGVRVFGRKGEGARCAPCVMYGRVFVCDCIYIWACVYVCVERGAIRRRGGASFFDIIY